MHSQSEYIITKQEVHDYANLWLGAALKLEYKGYKCNGTVLLQILLIAASRVVSIFAACRDLADAPSDDSRSCQPHAARCHLAVDEDYATTLTLRGLEALQPGVGKFF